MPTPHPALESSAHLLVPFAAASAPECQSALPGLVLPNLDKLLREMRPDPAFERVAGDEHSLSPPHERELALALGLCGGDGAPYGDGLIPWAAAQSDAPGTPQAWFSPCHFQVGMEQVSLLPGEQIALDAAQSRTLFDALAPYCAEDGIQLRFESPTRWHATSELFRQLTSASLDRVSGRQVDAWLAPSPAHPTGQLTLTRLQSEAQMLFYNHPVTDERMAHGLLPVNGFWVHGAGAHTGAQALHAPPHMPDALRQAALRTDWSAWSQAWAALDATLIPPLLQRVLAGEAATLTLCGERRAQRWIHAPRSATARLGRRLQQWMGTRPVWKILEDL